MTRHTPANCRNEECPACLQIHDDDADDPGYADDWRIGADRFEREIEGWGPQT